MVWPELLKYSAWTGGKSIHWFFSSCYPWWTMLLLLLELHDPISCLFATGSSTSSSSSLVAAESRSILGSTASTDGSSIRKCPHGDDESLNKCLRQILIDLRPKFTTGVPELNIPPMDPLKITNVAFQHGSGPVKVIASFSNVDVRGLSSLNKSDFG